jgi:hypothetical protein
MRCLGSIVLTAAFCSAQVTATYGVFGAGCPGTGIGLGGTQLLPAAAATTWGAGNAIPFGWSPNKYQQVFLGNELPAAFTMAALSLRQPHTGPVAHNFTIDVEIRVGYTTRWLPTLSTTFAANWDAGAPVTVLPRSLVDFPDQSQSPPANPTDVLLTIPWQNTFDWVPQAGRNLLVEVIVFGNSSGTIYGYPIDNLGGTVSIWGTPETATTANGGPVRTFGLVMGFVEQTHTAVPRLYSTDTPQIGNTFRVRLSQTAPSSIAALFFGWSSTTWNGVPLPMDLGGIGAPSCDLLVSPDDIRVLLTNGAGAANQQYDIPNVIYALGQSFYNQAFVFDPTVNPLGFVGTNGGVGVFGNQ